MKKYVLGFIALTTIVGCTSEQIVEAPEVPVAKTVAPAALAPELEIAFGYLDTYSIGGSREPLEIISTSVRDATDTPALRVALEQELSRILRSDATPDAKRYICRQLGLIGSDASVSALSDRLTDKELASAAIHALKRIPGDAASEVLRTAALELAPPYQLAVIASLGVRGEIDSASTLITLLENEDESVRRAALRALGTIGGKASCDALFTQWDADASSSQHDLIEACLDCAEEEVAQGQLTRATAFYETLIAPDYLRHQRTAALVGVVHAEPDQAQARLLEQVAADDEIMFMAAIGLLRNRRDHDLALPLAELLAELRVDRAVVLIEALVVREDTAAQASLITLLASESEALTIASASALGHLGDATAIAPLTEIAASKRGALQEAARASLALIADQEANAHLIRFVSEGDAMQRIEAVHALNIRNAQEAVPVLMDTVATSNETLYPAIMDSLSALAKATDIPALLTLLGNATHDWQRESVQETLVTIVQNSVNPAQASEALLAGLGIQGVHPTILRILGELESDLGLEAIRAALASTNPELRMAAIEALSEWTTRVTLPDLESVVRNEEAGPAREAAFQGCMRIIEAARDLSAEDQLSHIERMLELSKNTTERNLALSTLAELQSLAALESAIAWASKEASRAVAQNAVVYIADSIWGAYPAEVRAALAGVMGGDIGSDLREQAQDTLAAIDASTGYLTAWMVSGPYFEKNKSGTMIYDTVFAPEDPASKAQWSVFRSISAQQQPWVGKLSSVFGGKNRVVYLRTFLHVDDAVDAVLETGSNDGLKVWLNDDLVLGLNVPRGMTPGQDKTPVHLNKGWNTLMLAIYQHGGGWEFCAQLLSKDGTAIEGLQSAPETSALNE